MCQEIFLWPDSEPYDYLLKMNQLKIPTSFFYLWFLPPAPHLKHFLHINLMKTLHCHLANPAGSDSKESACNAGDWGLIPGSGISPGKGNETYSSILAWEIPWTEKPGGVTKSRTRLILSLPPRLRLIPYLSLCLRRGIKSMHFLTPTTLLSYLPLM